MSPAPRRGKKGAKAATVTAQKKKPGGKKRQVVVEDEDDDEDDEDEEQPKSSGRRVAKDYGVTGEQLAEWRDDGMGWQEIMDEVGAKSAIPLRKILHAYLAEQDEDYQLDIDDGDAIVAARDEEGLGWSQIAARAQASVADVKAAYTEAGGENLEGRAYKSKDGTVHFKLGANGAAATVDEDEELDEEDEDDEDEEEEQPKPRRSRGRAATAAKPRPAKAAPKAGKPRRKKK